MPTVLITGANRGLGLEFTRQYLERGWRVIAINRSHSPELEQLASSEQIRQLTGDLNDADFLSSLGDTLADESLNVLINNAGIMGSSTFGESGGQTQGLHDFQRNEWRQVFEINVFTPMQVMAALRSLMAEGGRLITISSEMGSISGNRFGGWSAYRASKAAVNSLMKSVALELQDQSLLAIALHPGWVRTDMGGSEAHLDAVESVGGMIRVIDDLESDQSGQFLGWNGTELAY